MPAEQPKCEQASGAPYRTPYARSRSRPVVVRWPLVVLLLGLGLIFVWTVCTALSRPTRWERCRTRCVEEATQCLEATRGMSPAARSIRAFACDESGRFCLRETCGPMSR